MKKVLVSLFAGLTLVLAFALSACGDNKNRTYYPTNDEMKTNLEKEGYVVSITTDLGEKSGTYLEAKNGEDYIYFYWVDHAENCEYYYNRLEEKCFSDYTLVKIENDEKFGNIVYCGTENAINAAGIKVVKVDVDVKV